MARSNEFPPPFHEQPGHTAHGQSRRVAMLTALFVSAAVIAVCCAGTMTKIEQDYVVAYSLDRDFDKVERTLIAISPDGWAEWKGRPNKILVMGSLNRQREVQFLIRLISPHATIETEFLEFESEP